MKIIKKNVILEEVDDDRYAILLQGNAQSVFQQFECYRRIETLPGDNFF